MKPIEVTQPSPQVRSTEPVIGAVNLIIGSTGSAISHPTEPKTSKTRAEILKSRNPHLHTKVDTCSSPLFKSRCRTRVSGQVYCQSSSFRNLHVCQRVTKPVNSRLICPRS